MLKHVFNQINFRYKGINIKEQKLNHLKFADDIVLISNRIDEAVAMLLMPNR